MKTLLHCETEWVRRLINVMVARMKVMSSR